MKDSIFNKLENLKDRYQELEALLSDGEVLSNQERFRTLSKEFAEIEPVVKAFMQFQEVQDQLRQAREMQKDSDSDIRAMADDEVKSIEAGLEQQELELQKLLLPRDEKDSCNIFLEVRAGTGGDEAAIFSGDLFRMYSRYAEVQGWRLEILSERPGEHGGYKEIITRIEGRNVFGHLKFESGAHRVQRVPATETQGRIHTSACTVAVMPAMDELAEIEINKADLRVDTYRSSGAGGQHVNKTDSAIRLTHIPTGIVVECQDERSQHKNRAQAWDMLRARLYERELEIREAEKNAAAASKTEIGWGHQIRSYVLQPYQMVKDLRTGYTSGTPDDVLDGDLDEFMQASLAQRISGAGPEHVDDVD